MFEYLSVQFTIVDEQDVLARLASADFIENLLFESGANFVPAVKVNLFVVFDFRVCVFEVFQNRTCNDVQRDLAERYLFLLGFALHELTERGLAKATYPVEEDYQKLVFLAWEKFGRALLRF